MRIAFLTREYPPDATWGGIATAYYGLARALTDRGHEIHVICQAVGKPRDYIDDGVFVYRVGTNPRRYSATARTNYSFHAWRKLKELIKLGKVEIVDATLFGAEGFFCCLFSSIPIVVSSHGTAKGTIQTRNYTGIQEFLGFNILSVLENFTAKRANRIVANSRYMFLRLTTEDHFAPDRISIIHHGIDTVKFCPCTSNIREQLGISDSAPLVLSVGRLEFGKGTHILCKAIPHIKESVPNVKVIFLGRDSNKTPGGGSFKAYINEMARTGNFTDNVFFIDFLSQDDLIPLYSSCDVLVSASLLESFGLIVIEAMSCGLPIVATPTGIVPELHPYGLKGLSIVPIGDYVKLADAVIHYLLQGENDRKEIAKENRRLIESKFSLYNWSETKLTVYRQVLASCNK